MKTPSNRYKLCDILDKLYVRGFSKYSEAQGPIPHTQISFFLILDGDGDTEDTIFFPNNPILFGSLVLDFRINDERGSGTRTRQSFTSLNHNRKTKIISLQLRISDTIKKILILDFKIMNSSWANLPRHLLDSVVRRLGRSRPDYLRFSVVCQPWYCTAKDNISEICAKESSGLRDSPPMLLIPTGEKSRVWKLYDVTNDTVLCSQLIIPNKRFCGSSKGWLIFMESDFAITLLNPLHGIRKTNKVDSTIRLPPIALPDDLDKDECAKVCNSYALKGTISADPILNANNYIVMVIYLDLDQLAFIRPGRYNEWIYVDKRYKLIEEVLFVQDRVYAVDYWSKFLCFDITTQGNSTVEEIDAGRDLKEDQREVVKKYILNLNEKEFFMVHRYATVDHEARKQVTSKFKIFKWASNKCKWHATKKGTMCDVAIFLGDNSSVCVQASKISGCRPNCIYFTQDQNGIFLPGDWKFHDFGVYDIESKCLLQQPYTTEAMNLMQMANRPPIWILPRLQL